MTQCEHCRQDADDRGLCKYHLVRRQFNGVNVGDEVVINGYGPMMVRRKKEWANHKAEYVDTKFETQGNLEDGSLLIIELYMNDSGSRGTGRPSYNRKDRDGKSIGGANHVTELRFAGKPRPDRIHAEKYADDLGIPRR